MFFWEFEKTNFQILIKCYINGDVIIQLLCVHKHQLQYIFVMKTHLQIKVQLLHFLCHLIESDTVKK